MKNQNPNKIKFKELLLYNKYVKAFGLLNSVLSHTFQDGNLNKIAIKLKTTHQITRTDLLTELSKHKLENVYRSALTKQYIPEFISDVLLMEAEEFICWIKECRSAKAAYIYELGQKQAFWDNGLDEMISDTLDRRTDTFDDVIAMQNLQMSSSFETCNQIQGFDTNELFMISGRKECMSIADTLEIENVKLELKNRYSRTFHCKNGEMTILPDARTENLTDEKAHAYVDGVLQKCKSILWVWEQGSLRMLKLTKENIISRIVDMFIDNFAEYDEIEFTAKQVKTWQEGSYVIRTPEYGAAYLRINPDNSEEVEVSQGTILPRQECKRTIEELIAMDSNQCVYSKSIGTCAISINYKGKRKIEVEVRNYTIPWKHLEEFYHRYLNV